MPIAKEILDMLEIGRKPSQVVLVLFLIENSKNHKDRCSHCAMDLDYCFRCLSTVPSHRIIALLVHPVRTSNLSIITSFPLLEENVSVSGCSSVLKTEGH